MADNPGVHFTKLSGKISAAWKEASEEVKAKFQIIADKAKAEYKVDIDADVVRFCREHLPENSEAFASPRLELIIDDAKAVIEKATDTYDVIIMDLDDPLEGGPCYQLYTTEFYQMLKSKLNPGGILVTQSGQSGMKQHHLVFSPINRTL